MAVARPCLAGSRRSFQFETWREDERERAFALPVWSNPTLFAARPRREQDWNLLLISLDTLRADRLPMYGYPLDTAPFLQRSFGAARFR